MFCHKCGREIPGQARFCPRCGAPVSNAGNSVPDGTGPAGPAGPAEQAPAARTETAAAVADKSAKKRKSKAPLIIAVAVVLAAALTAAGLFLLPKLPIFVPSAEDTSPVQEETEDVEPTSEPEDVNKELLALIDRAEKTREKANNDLPPLDPDLDGDGMIDSFGDYVEQLRQAAQILDGFVTDLEELRKEAAAVSGPDDKMKSAGDEYFSMLRDARSAHLEAIVFLADYFEFWDEVAGWRPYEDEYDSLTDYAVDLYDWALECKESYAAISYPSCVESEWKQYGEALEYNESIARKLYQAVQYNDWLRYYSTVYMSDRYDIVEDVLYGKLLDCIGAEFDHVDYQLRCASGLAEEMHTYAELDPEKKETYEFENNLNGKIMLNYETVDTIYPSLYNTYDAFVIFKTGCLSGTRSVVVEAEIEGFTQKYRQSFNLDSSYKAIYIKPPALTGELNLSSSKSAQIKITISEKDGTLIDAKTFPVTIKSKNDVEWYSDDYGVATMDNILCYLTPESEAVTELKRQAIDEITAMTGGSMQSFVGYQEAGWNHYVVTYLQAAGLMNALYDMGVRYTKNDFSLSGSNQHVLFPAEVIKGRTGLCIETSLVIASALQSAGMHAFLVFPPGHAQVAVEVWNSGEGQGEYFLIETTYLTDDINNKQHFVDNANKLLDYTGSTGVITYYSASSWADYLENSAYYLVDCNDSQLLGLTAFVN